MLATRWRGLAVGACLAIATVPRAEATTYASQQFTCPIGGEKFEANVVASNSTFGQRPDGKPYSPLPVYPLVECPGNGLILFEETFAPDDLAKLTPAIASDEFKAMRSSETQYYRAWWLMQQVGRDRYALARVLLQASWESDDDPARKTRYQNAFVEAVQKLDRQKDKNEWFWLNLRAANALREIGRFDEASAALTSLDTEQNLPDDADERAGARSLIDGLRLLIADQNRAAEPANLIPQVQATFRCTEPGLTAVELRICGTPEMKAAIEEVQRNLEEARTAAREAAAAAADAAAERN
jgi:hypothetical protein